MLNFSLLPGFCISGCTSMTSAPLYRFNEFTLSAVCKFRLHSFPESYRFFNVSLRKLMDQLALVIDETKPEVVDNNHNLSVLNSI